MAGLSLGWVMEGAGSLLSLGAGLVQAGTCGDSANQHNSHQVGLCLGSFHLTWGSAT